MLFSDDLEARGSFWKVFNLQHDPSTHGSQFAFFLSSPHGSQFALFWVRLTAPSSHSFEFTSRLAVPTLLSLQFFSRFVLVWRWTLLLRLADRGLNSQSSCSIPFAAVITIIGKFVKSHLNAELVKTTLIQNFNQFPKIGVGTYT